MYSVAKYIHTHAHDKDGSLRERKVKQHMYF